MAYIWGPGRGPGQLATGSQTPRPPDVASPDFEDLDTYGYTCSNVHVPRVHKLYMYTAAAIKLNK